MLRIVINSLGDLPVLLLLKTGKGVHSYSVQRNSFETRDKTLSSQFATELTES